MSEAWVAGIILITLVFIIIAVPCVFIAFLGYKMLNKLAYFPSKNPAIQMSILFWLMIVEVASVTMLLTFYHVFADYSKDQGARKYERGIRIAVFRLEDRNDHILSAQVFNLG